MSFDSNSDPKIDRVVELEHALSYAHNSFINCTGQRIKIFHFFTLAVGLYELFREIGRDQNCFTSLFIFVFMILIISTIIAIIFSFLEKRHRKLVQISRNSCMVLEHMLEKALMLELDKECEKNKNWKQVVKIYSSSKLRIMFSGHSKNLNDEIWMDKFFEKGITFSHGEILSFFFALIIFAHVGALLWFAYKIIYISKVWGVTIIVCLLSLSALWLLLLLFRKLRIFFKKYMLKSD